MWRWRFSLWRKENRLRQGSIDGLYAFPHPFGCSQTGHDHVQTRKLLAALTRHPNAGAVLVVGRFSDMMGARGGFTTLTEVPEMFGADGFLLNRCAGEAVFEKAVNMINGFKNYFISHKETVYDNPSPGNRQGGITTLEDKSCGCVQKGGTAPIMDVIGYGDQVVTKGLNMLYGPGNDLVSATAMTAAGAHLIFHPEAEEMYAPDFSTYVEMQKVSEGLCGRTRPTHFRGVCTVVCKLFHIVMPDRAYFGQKDAQQLAIVKGMVRDLNLPVRVVGCPIVREDDGLAKSSRNTYLSAAERQAALVLSRAVAAGQRAVEAGERDAHALKRLMLDILESEPLARVDYLEVVDGLTMQPVERIGSAALVALAVYIGSTRLIDNFIFEEPPCC